MIQSVVTAIIVVIAVAFAIRYIWLEITNPCRHCTKECHRRKKSKQTIISHFFTHSYRTESSDRRRFEVTEIRMSQSQIVKIAKLRLKIYFLRTYFRDFDSLFSNRHPQVDKSSTPPPVKRPSHRNEKRRNCIRLLQWRWRESNSRPNKEPKSFLHAQLSFNPSIKVRQTTAKTLIPAPKFRTITEAHIALSLKR